VRIENFFYFSYYVLGYLLLCFMIEVNKKAEEKTRKGAVFYAPQKLAVSLSFSISIIWYQSYSGSEHGRE
jgi:hypothetical protein